MKKLAFALGLLATPHAQACGLELVLALDVSRSVERHEFALQRDGLADAFRHPGVLEAISWVQGGVMVAVTQWSNENQQASSISWRHIKSDLDALALSADLAELERAFWFYDTAPGEALLHADALSAENPLDCDRRVIDISGDGIENAGIGAKGVADQLAKRGVTINALVIAGARPDPVEYFLRDVVRGPGSFVEIAQGFEDFPRAIVRKLIREMAPNVAWIKK